MASNNTDVNYVAAQGGSYSNAGTSPERQLIEQAHRHDKTELESRQSARYCRNKAYLHANLLQSSLAYIFDQIESLTKKLQELEQKMATEQDEIGIIQADDTTLQADTTAIKNAVSTLQTANTTLQAEVTSLQAQGQQPSQAVMDTLTHLRTTITTLEGAIPQAAPAVTGTTATDGSTNAVATNTGG